MRFNIQVYNANEYEYDVNNKGVYVKNKATGEKIFIYNGFALFGKYDEEDGLYIFKSTVFSSVPHFVIVCHS